ncbi:MAG: glycosyltransferase family 4 protein [Myxococcales bacterium FL481]|nr:MAG: glycosyltransferase family 4 protein [Myxococcales bacterium FL481]
MRITFLTHYYPPEGNAPASRVHAMCRRWVEAGHEVTVLTCAPNVPDGVVYTGYRNRWYSREVCDGVQVIRGWIYIAANRGLVRRIASFLSYFVMAVWRSLRLPKPDVVVATTPQFFCGWAGVWAARWWRCKFVLEVRDLWPESIVAVTDPERWRGGLRGAVLRYLEWLERRMYQAADHIVTVGDGYRQRLLDKGVDTRRLTVVTNGVESQLFVPRAPDRTLRAQAGAADDQFLVGYVGTVGMAHGLEVVLDAARLARDRGQRKLRFLVVGDGAQRATLEADLARDDPGNVRFVGRRPKSEMPRWLASVDACLVHLRPTQLFQTVLPSKMFEALAMERPVILGVDGYAAKLLRALQGGVVVRPGSAEELVTAAAAWAEDLDHARSVGRRGRQAVLRGYDLDHLAGRYEQLLLQVSEGRSPAGYDERSVEPRRRAAA